MHQNSEHQNKEIVEIDSASNIDDIFLVFNKIIVNNSTVLILKDLNKLACSDKLQKIIMYLEENEKLKDSVKTIIIRETTWEKTELFSAERLKSFSEALSACQNLKKLAVLNSKTDSKLDENQLINFLSEFLNGKNNLKKIIININNKNCFSKKELFFNFLKTINRNLKLIICRANTNDQGNDPVFLLGTLSACAENQCIQSLCYSVQSNEVNWLCSAFEAVTDEERNNLYQFLGDLWTFSAEFLSGLAHIEQDEINKIILRCLSTENENTTDVFPDNQEGGIIFQKLPQFGLRPRPLTPSSSEESDHTISSPDRTKSLKK